MALQALLIILIVLAVLLAVGVPISYAIGISSLAAILQVVPLDVSVLTASQRIFVGMSKFSLTAIPFFILAGNLMNQGGIAKRLVDFVLAILGKLPGSLLVTNIGANALFGAISGSAAAAAAAVGSMVREGEEDQGYNLALCAATNGASAPSGLLIPPSNALITYSLVSGGTSVAALFLAGYLPGVIWAACCILVDKEEIGSVGATGMQSKFFENALVEVMTLAGQYSDLAYRRCLANSCMLSSDVSSAFDPTYASSFDKKNVAYLGGGMVFNKFTGARGKSGSNDANAEYLAYLRRILDVEKVNFQTAELGKVDLGGGGTIAYILALYGMNVIDSGVPVLNMHAPWEAVSKADLYEAKRGYAAFLQGEMNF